MIASLFTGFLTTKLGKLLPSWAWELVFIALLIGGVMLVHHVEVVHHDTAIRLEQKQADDAAWQKAFDKEREAAAQWRQAFDSRAAAISNDERKIHDQAVASDAAAADALRLRGPGAASATHCGQVDHPGTTSAPGGRDQAPAKPDAAGPSLPPADSADVPWSWLIDRAQEHDDLRAEVQAWRNWYVKQRANWPK